MGKKNWTRSITKRGPYLRNRVRLYPRRHNAPDPTQIQKSFRSLSLSLHKRNNNNKKDPTHVLFTIPLIQIPLPSSNGYTLSLSLFHILLFRLLVFPNLTPCHFHSPPGSLCDLCSQWSTSCNQGTRSWGRRIPRIHRRRWALAWPSRGRLGSRNRRRRTRLRPIWTCRTIRSNLRPSWRVNCHRGRRLQILSSGS